MALTPENRIEAFIELIKDQASIFSAENRVDLEQQLDTFPEDDITSFSNAITAWCLEYLHINLALSEKLDTSHDSMPGQPKGVTRTIPPRKPEYYKDQIKNQMRDSFPETTQEQKPSDTSQ
ncbi:MAG: hypothetical protein F6K47_39175 [Symploca sp. SIO2E6]|nr:hypothetical protein [Symploca sp. SIO2E6]